MHTEWAKNNNNIMFACLVHVPVKFCYQLILTPLKDQLGSALQAHVPVEFR